MILLLYCHLSRLLDLQRLSQLLPSLASLQLRDGTEVLSDIGLSSAPQMNDGQNYDLRRKFILCSVN